MSILKSSDYSPLLESLSRQTKEKSDWVLDSYKHAITPILISRNVRKNYRHEPNIETHPYMIVGTGTYIIFGGRRWLVTANHVVERVLEDTFHSAPPYVLNGNTVVQLYESIGSFRIYPVKNYDLALIPLSEDSSCNYDKVTWLTENDFYTGNYANELWVVVYGFLKKKHTAVSNVADLSQLVTKVSEVNGHRVSLKFDRKKFEGHSVDSNIIPQPDGASGGPVFGLGNLEHIAQRSQWKAWFCGIFIEQKDKGAASSAVFVNSNALKVAIGEASLARASE